MVRDIEPFCVELLPSALLVAFLIALKSPEFVTNDFTILNRESETAVGGEEIVEVW